MFLMALGTSRKDTVYLHVLLCATGSVKAIVLNTVIPVREITTQLSTKLRALRSSNLASYLRLLTDCAAMPPKLITPSSCLGVPMMTPNHRFI